MFSDIKFIKEQNKILKYKSNNTKDTESKYTQETGHIKMLALCRQSKTIVIEFRILYKLT